MHARMTMTMMYRNKVNDLKESIKKIQWEISNVRARRLARRYSGLESRARDQEESSRIESMDAELVSLERQEHFLLQELTRALETQARTSSRVIPFIHKIIRNLLVNTIWHPLFDPVDGTLCEL